MFGLLSALDKTNMKLHVLCDCDDNKVCTGNFDGKPMWHYKIDYPTPTETNNRLINISRIIPKNEWTSWMKEEVYQANKE